MEDGDLATGFKRVTWFAACSGSWRAEVASALRPISNPSAALSPRAEFGNASYLTRVVD